jgi:hypothetical protein
MLAKRTVQFSATLLNCEKILTNKNRKNILNINILKTTASPTQPYRWQNSAFDSVDKIKMKQLQ